MNFKKPKEQLLSEAYAAAQDRIHGTLMASLPYGLHIDNDILLNALLNALTYAMSNGIDAAMRVIVENTYTDQEFEEDMGLRSGPIP